jgi:hypothetical protein
MATLENEQYDSDDDDDDATSPWQVLFQVEK